MGNGGQARCISAAPGPGMLMPHLLGSMAVVIPSPSPSPLPCTSQFWLNHNTITLPLVPRYFITAECDQNGANFKPFLHIDQRAFIIHTTGMSVCLSIFSLSRSLTQETHPIAQKAAHNTVNFLSIQFKVHSLARTAPFPHC